MFEVSAVKKPAYVQSTIAARSIEVVEDVEVPDEEKRELTLQEQIDVNKSLLKSYEKLANMGEADVKLEKSISTLKGEIRQMEAQVKSQAVTETEKHEERATTQSPTLSNLLPVNLIRDKVKNEWQAFLSGTY